MQSVKLDVLLYNMAAHEELDCTFADVERYIAQHGHPEVADDERTRQVWERDFKAWLAQQ